MPFMRPPLSRSDKVRRGPLFYLVVVVLPLSILGVGAGYGVSRIVRAHNEWLRRAAEEVARIRLSEEDLVLRHPDLDLAAWRSGIDAFLALPLRRQARELESARSLIEVLRRKCAELVGAPSSAAASRAYKTFSANGFRAFYDSLKQPETTAPVAGSPITGLEAADAHITELAVRRGYRLRPLAQEEALVAEGDNWTHPATLKAFRAMRQAARSDGIELGIVSGYRSLASQRGIFLAGLAEKGAELRRRSVSTREIAGGEADDVVDLVLSKNSIPGYSKHHTGYALDLEDRSSGTYFTEFEKTAAHRWLSANNYLNAKRFGFLPSYPPGASSQGPDPEPWEYVYVGEELLRDEP